MNKLREISLMNSCRLNKMLFARITFNSRLLSLIFITTLKKNLVIITKRILFSVLVQYLVSVIKHNNNNQLFGNNSTLIF